MSKLHKKTGAICMICGDTSNNLILLHKTRRQSHCLCEDCCVGYLKQILGLSICNLRKNIKTGADDIKCPGVVYGKHRNQCSHVVKLGDMIIPSSKLTEKTCYYIDIIILVLYFDNKYLCPKTDCYCITDVCSDYNGTHLICHDGCSISWCKNCLNSPYHVGKSCLEFEIENKKTETGEFIQNLKSQGKLKFCPQCRAASIKKGGCNKITCRCSLKWCWLCEKSGIDYDHFRDGGQDRCSGKLWKE